MVIVVPHMPKVPPPCTSVIKLGIDRCQNNITGGLKINYILTVVSIKMVQSHHHAGCKVSMQIVDHQSWSVNFWRESRYLSVVNIKILFQKVIVFSWYWTGTSFQRKLMRGNIMKKRSMLMRFKTFSA